MKIIDEATLDYNTQVKKMADWHNGVRKQNLSMSDEKLKMNHDICVKNGYIKEAEILRRIGESRGLGWASPYPYTQQGANARPSGPSVSVKINNMTVEITPDDFTQDLANEVYRAKDVDDATKRNAMKSIIHKYAIPTPDPKSSDGAEIIKVLITITLLAAIMKADELGKLFFGGILHVFHLNGHNAEIAAVKTSILNVLKQPDILNKALSVISNLQVADVDELEEGMEKHQELNPKLFEGERLKPEVREKLVQIADEFINGIKDDDVKFELSDVKIVGSNCNYNYNPDSDLDLHIVADTSKLGSADDLYPIVYNLYKSAWNNKYEPTIYGIPVEIYVETEGDRPVAESVEDSERYREEERDAVDSYQGGIDNPESTDEEREIYKHIQDEEREHLAELEKLLDDQPIEEAVSKNPLVSNGAYSVLNDEWISKPVAVDVPEIDQSAIDEILTPLNDECERLKSATDADEIDDFMDKLYAARQKSIATEGEYNPTNYAFKTLRAEGKLDELRELKRKLKEAELSLN